MSTQPAIQAINEPTHDRSPCRSSGSNPSNRPNRPNRSSRLRRVLVAGTATTISFAGLASLAPTAEAAPRAFGAAPHAIRTVSLHGQALLDRIGSRIDAAAKKSGVSAARFRDMVRTDASLHLDDDLNLVYEDPAPLPAAEERSAPEAKSAALPYASSSTFKLHSRPTSTKKIYLDFNGQYFTDTVWNHKYMGDSPADVLGLNTEGSERDFSTNEQAIIQSVFQSVREDFAAFDADVTTEDPGVDALRKTSPDDKAYGTRVVITPNVFTNCACGGQGYYGSFQWSTETPVFVFIATSQRAKFIAEAASHETGHSLGLHHDGHTNGTEYYAGQGDWAPIMGVGYGKPVTQWSKGEYAGANNTEDDFTVMAQNGLSPIADDHLGTTATVSTLPAGVTRTGVIGINHDVDAFKFSVGGTRMVKIVSSSIAGAGLGDVNLRAVLKNSAGIVIATASPTTSLGTTFTVTIPAGLYYLYLDGVGQGTALSTGYSGYSSIGQYSVVLNWA